MDWLAQNFGKDIAGIIVVAAVAVYVWDELAWFRRWKTLSGQLDSDAAANNNQKNYDTTDVRYLEGKQK
jgi:hypothetical protein